MENPPHSKEDLLYTTLQIKCIARVKNINKSGHTDKGKSGTGFIFNFNRKKVSTIEKPYYQNEPEFELVQTPYLVTNKHVIKDAISIKLNFHLSDNTSKEIEYHKQNGFELLQKEFIFHPLKDIDLCAIPLSSIISSLESQNQPNKVLYKSLNFSHLVNFNNEEGIQDILMVGYPIGIFDYINNLPILRKGITSSNLKVNFQGKPEVLIDAACFPGSSGSPVFLDQNNQYFQSKLLGILWGGPQHTVQGNIVYDNNQINRQPIPTEVTTQVPSHLGYVIKSTELTNIQEVINKYTCK